eukprot:6023764-Prymnesium_polylepis.1
MSRVRSSACPLGGLFVCLFQMCHQAGQGPTHGTALHGLWPMVRHKSVLERYAALRTGASGTGYVSLRRLIGSRLVPST